MKGGRKRSEAAKLERLMKEYVELVVSVGEKKLDEAWKVATKASTKWLEKEIKRLRSKARRHWKKRQSQAKHLSKQFREGFPI